MFTSMLWWVSCHGVRCATILRPFENLLAQPQRKGLVTRPSLCSSLSCSVDGMIATGDYKLMCEAHHGVFKFFIFFLFIDNSISYFVLILMKLLPIGLHGSFYTIPWSLTTQMDSFSGKNLHAWIFLNIWAVYMALSYLNICQYILHTTLQ